MKGWLGALSVWWRLSFALLLVHQFQIKDEVLAITGNQILLAQRTTLMMAHTYITNSMAMTTRNTKCAKTFLRAWITYRA